MKTQLGGIRLFYDGKCHICRSLAFKIHFLSSGKVGVVSLTTKEAKTTLDSFYPAGWKWDFYVVENGTCSRGLKALPKLIPALGIRSLRSLVADYGRYWSRGPCTTKMATASTGWRSAMQALAFTPFMYLVSKIPAEGAMETSATGITVNIADVTIDNSGPPDYVARAWECPHCVRSVLPVRPKPTRKKIVENRVSATLLDSTAPAWSDSDEGVVMTKILRSSFSARYEDGGPSREIATFGASVTHPRFDIAVHAGRDLAVTMAAMTHHDLPVPVVDEIVFTDTNQVASSHLRGFAAGVRELRELHTRANRHQLAQVYGQVQVGLLSLADEFEASVSEVLQPPQSRMVITSMPDLLRSVRLPEELQQRWELSRDRTPVAEGAVQPMGCDCSCSCDLCCGCGCSFGFCGSPFPCDCDCCLGCDCGCGCCLGDELW